jgi:hypothetical protein
MKTIIVHIANEDAIVGEVEELPEPIDQTVTIQNPRRRDGMDIHYVDEEVSTLIIPWHRINFIQVLPAGGEEDVIGFVRE